MRVAGELRAHTASIACAYADKIHELRHSAADNLWRQTGNLMLAQQLLRHESVATTQVYLHPNRDDLAAALRALEKGSK